jgi:hypothetical protein
MVRWGLVLAIVGVVALEAAAAPPYDAQSIHVRGQDVVVGTSFGMIVSHDGGGTWHWFCPNAVHYGGQYAPDYQITSNGVYATSFDGLIAMSDGCSFGATGFGTTFFSRLAQGSDGALYAAAADASDGKIYKSTNGGASFPSSAAPGVAGDWWDSIIVAPSNAQRVYLSGYRLVLRCTAGSGNAGATCTGNQDCTNNGNCEPQKDQLLFASSDGAASFSPLATTAFATTMNSVLDVVAVDAADADRVYAMVTMVNATNGSDLYRSDNAGGTWTKILTTTDNRMSVVARANGQLVAAWQSGIARVSTDHGDTWTPIGCDVHINCLAENAAGELWACTHNYADFVSIPSDGFGLMKTTDLVEWSGVLSFADIGGPASCAAGTVEHDMCAGQWPTLVADFLQFQVTPNHCAMPPDGSPDGATPADAATNPTAGEGGGCCSSTGRGSTSGVLGAGVLALLLRRRRR